MSADVSTGESVVTYTGIVHGVDCDLMGHLNTARSAAIFDSATWSMLSRLGYRWHRDAELGWERSRSRCSTPIPDDYRAEIARYLSAGVKQ